MSFDFKDAKRLFENDEISRLADTDLGYRFLLLRSLSRREYMLELASKCSLVYGDVPSRDLLRTLFENLEIRLEDIINVISTIYGRERATRRRSEPELLSELYSLQTFDWGGLHQNSLEKTIVDNYVKQITNYGHLCDAIEDRLYPSLRHYVLCSWYNHWTSIIIEDVFKDHSSVLPTVGLVKKVDFFINRIPFDLKVTYLPEGFVKLKRRQYKLRPEITLLKRFCRSNGILFSNLPEARLLEDLWTKVADHPAQEANELISDLKTFRDNMVSDIIDDSSELIRWLYENQGVRRFDASNRLFLILINRQNYFDSWKLKRAREILVENIHNALNAFSCDAKDKLVFSWEGATYTTTAKAFIVVKE